MNKEKARFILNTNEAQRVVASSARISTQPGTALEIFEASGGEKDLKLIGKVLSSGHKSVLEHQMFSVAFDNVSVLAEQFIIEFRLASYTVKSRRYVDFSNAGFVIPDDMNAKVLDVYTRAVEQLFETYRQLLDLDIPKEDARFVLPYGFRSNFYATMNARELINMIGAMLKGRGAAYSELRSIGMQLKQQFDAVYPGILDTELTRIPEEKSIAVDLDYSISHAVKPAASLVGKPFDAIELLKSSLSFNGRFTGIDELVRDARPRELEVLNYTYLVKDLSLACLTHFTRHRMLSLQTQPVVKALLDGGYVLPDSVLANEKAKALYTSAFEKQTELAKSAAKFGAEKSQLAYFAMAGHTTSILITFNARELLHFAKLRTCTRAQWEIREIAKDMVKLAVETDACELFRLYGPTCAVTGKCPEGKMTCGHPVKSLFEKADQ